jgi:hypothetical protein
MKTRTKMHINNTYIGVSGKSISSESNLNFETSISSIVSSVIVRLSGGIGGKSIISYSNNNFKYYF